MKHVLIFALLAVLLGNLSAQSGGDSSSFTKQLHTMTTLIQTTSFYTNKQRQVEVNTGQGTGFYFSKLDSTAKNGIASTWLISNRHVLFPKGKMPDTISIYIRRRVENKVIWSLVNVADIYIRKNLKLYPDTTVDIAAINMTEAFIEAEKAYPDLEPIITLSSRNFVNSRSVKPEVGDDILAVGYPKGYHDSFNKFPVVKSGIIASGYGQNFNNTPTFMIDCKLFPGSSGSLVIAKPQRDIWIKDGKLLYNNEKEFLLLGVFSGEPAGDIRTFVVEDMTITHVGKYNLGVVWYAELIKELLDIK